MRQVLKAKKKTEGEKKNKVKSGSGFQRPKIGRPLRGRTRERKASEPVNRLSGFATAEKRKKKTRSNQRDPSRVNKSNGPRVPSKNPKTRRSEVGILCGWMLLSIIPRPINTRDMASVLG
jgi:hypothetical protein